LRLIHNRHLGPLYPTPQQIEITEETPLLQSNGKLTKEGWARRPLFIYDRSLIKANAFRIKEWDYYYIGTQEYGLCLTISDIGYVSCLSISLLEFSENPIQYNDSEIGLFPLGDLRMPKSSVSGNVKATVGSCEMSFLNDGKTRILSGKYENYCNSGKTLTFDIKLTDIPKESMVIATPFESEMYFYYNQKINCMLAEGYCEFNNKRYVFISPFNKFKRNKFNINLSSIYNTYPGRNKSAENYAYHKHNFTSGNDPIVEYLSKYGPQDPDRSFILF